MVPERPIINDTIDAPREKLATRLTSWPAFRKKNRRPRPISAIEETRSPIIAADLYAVLSEFLISPDRAVEEGAMLPVTTVVAPVTTETKQRAAPPKKTAAFRCPTNTNRAAAISAIISISGTY